MDFSTISQTVAAFIVSIGGAGVIIIAASKWFAERIAERMLKKIDFEFSGKLEEVKSNLDKKSYISKVRFDLEIEIYRQLSEATYQMVFDCNSLFPSGEPFGAVDDKVQLKNADKNMNCMLLSYKCASDAIYRNAPFIPKDVHDAFFEVMAKCKQQGIDFYFWAKRESPDMPPDAQSLDALKDKAKQRTDEIQDQLRALINTLRKHIASLDVLDK